MKQWRKSGHVVEPMECKEMQAQNSTVIQMQERKKKRTWRRRCQGKRPAVPAIWNHSRLILSS